MFPFGTSELPASLLLYFGATVMQNKGYWDASTNILGEYNRAM